MKSIFFPRNSREREIPATGDSFRTIKMRKDVQNSRPSGPVVDVPTFRRREPSHFSVSYVSDTSDWQTSEKKKKNNYIA